MAEKRKLVSLCRRGHYRCFELDRFSDTGPARCLDVLCENIRDGIYFFKDIGILKLSPKSADLAANIIGGLIFGVGFALAGYCPTTGIGAISEGRYDALLGAIPGMLYGAAIYAEAYSFLKDSLLKWGSLGKITIPDLLGIGYPYHWMLILLICTVIILFMRVLERRGL